MFLTNQVLLCLKRVGALESLYIYIYWRKAAVGGDVKWCLAIFPISWDLRPPWAPPERKLQVLSLRAAGNVLCAHAAAHETDPQQS